MLKIKKKTVRKEVTLDEFLRLKKDGDRFEKMRQDSKAINFGMIFGMSGATFARTTLETAWTEAMCDDYIKLNNLRALKEQIINRYPRESPAMWKAITCATDIRTKFFDAYKGLKERIEREKSFARKNGYIQTWHGAYRRLPELFLAAKGDNGDIRSDDMSVYGAHMSNLGNIAANTAIQNFEASTVMMTIVKLNNWLKETGKKTYIFGTVHDSIDFCIYKPELKEVCLKIRELCAPPLDKLPAMWQGMPMDVDIVVADITQGEYYKGGKPWKAYVRD
jgi:DNA polymerase I-like protein with 3'-5' exonuclease and polymerase domains